MKLIEKKINFSQASLFECIFARLKNEKTTLYIIFSSLFFVIYHRCFCPMFHLRQNRSTNGF